MSECRRIFKCASCSHVFEHSSGTRKCPECGSKVLILEEGPSLRSGGCGCGGNCGSCGCGCHH